VLEGLRQLIELQKLDDELHRREREQASIPEQRARRQEERTAAESRAEQATQALEAAAHELRQAETALQDREALKTKLEGQQFQVRSNEAYTALLHEIEAATRAISDLETRILEAMDSLEKARGEKASAEKGCEAAVARIEADEQALDAREKALAAETEALQADRQGLCARIEPALLDQYTRVAGRRRPAVVTVAHELCGGCRVNIPPQHFVEIQSQERVVVCGHCHRILVHADVA
jgi:predicted  nucleic acid-binding Zn-ribbon protein